MTKNNDRIMQIMKLMTNNYHYLTLFLIISRYSKMGVGSYGLLSLNVHYLSLFCFHISLFFMNSVKSLD